ncbi:hypothetical protein [Amycolatopsis keratiniphila]|uniref:Uncharacterized protein n=1 Tax=Amycolatopsis keratiniphila subsp. keratiniphila TaxID=227715 RepID=A0A1W2M353_9PSEU|nr:hypothetical protein [Amycolatopsis keratiniphila]ONF73970.1 hypothetical protein AVR91_0204365 [Amycolatopsis keratiniphila subsp. keratiniphila]
MTGTETNLAGAVRLMADMQRRQDRGERLTLELGPHTALTLAGMLQWASEENAGVEMFAPLMFEPFLVQLREAFADEPDVVALLSTEETHPNPR